jgi:PrtD family type I secretion system ABC transporter
MGIMPALIKRCFVKNELVLNSQDKLATLSARMLSISKFLRMVLQILMLGIGALLVLQNAITAGAMIAGSILLNRALAPLEQSVSTWRNYLNSKQAYTRLQDHFAVDTRRSAGIQLPEPTGAIEIKGLFYRTGAETDAILANINFAIEPGEQVALIGPSGAGKSTLARLIMGVLAPTVGHVRLDGADTFTWDRYDFGRYVGYLPQDVELFTGTMKENIARLGEVDDEAVIKAAQLAGVHDVILRLPQGYDSQFSQSGYSLSGGQRQRVALARALYGDPKLVVLDEPNSNLDSDGEDALMRALGWLKEHKVTTILIAHRPSLLQHVDKVVVINQGQIQFAGPRDEILRKIQQLSPHQTESSRRNGGK